MNSTVTPFLDFMRSMHDPTQGHVSDFDRWINQIPPKELYGWIEAYRTDEIVRLSQYLIQKAESYFGEDL